MSDTESRVSTLLHEATTDLSPDVSRIVRGGRQRGRRRRTARIIGGSVCAAAVVAAVGFGISSIAGGTTSSGPQYATSDAPSVLAAGEVIDLGNGITGTVVEGKPDGVFYDLGGSWKHGTGSSFTILVDGPADAVQEFRGSQEWDGLVDDYPGITIAVAQSDLSTSLGFSGGTYDPSPFETPPFDVTLDGWTCGEAFSARMTCHGPGTASVAVAWHPAARHADYDAGGSKTSDFVSAVHGDWFATVDGAQAQAVGKSLDWTD